MSIESLFDSLSVADVNEFISRGQEEHLQLDFKLVNTPPDFSQRDDRKNLAVALSGFANSSGGLIVWGIEAKRGVDGVDHACGKREIESLPLFISRLNSLTGQAVSPIIDGIRHNTLQTSHDKGFAVTLVPESSSGPHMAKLGEDRYYKRSGDSFRKMEHFDIEDMFGRRKRPKLSLKARPVVFRPMGSESEIEFAVGIENAGRGTAKAPFLSVSTPPGCEWSRYGLDGNSRFGLPPIVGHSWEREKSFGANSDFVIHPGVTLDVTILKLTQPAGTDVYGSLTIHYRLAAEDMQMIEESAVVSAEEIHRFVQHRKS